MDTISGILHSEIKREKRQKSNLFTTISKQKNPL
jgi:hypothetical protein